MADPAPSGRKAAVLIATIRELATNGQSRPSHMGYSMCIGGESFHHPPPAAPKSPRPSTIAWPKPAAPKIRQSQWSYWP